MQVYLTAEFILLKHASWLVMGNDPELRDACSLKQGQFRQYLYQARDLI